MGVIYFLVCVRSYESNLPTNIWGRKHNDREKNAAFWVKPHSCLIILNLWQHGVFSFTKVCIFLPMVFIRTFITTFWFYDFCKTVLVKKCTPCQGVVWFSPPKCHIFFTGFELVLYLHNCAPLTLRTSCKKSQGCCPQAPTRAYAPQTLRFRVLKKWPSSQFFLLHVLPQSVMNLRWLFNFF